MDEQPEKIESSKVSKIESPFVFISHDTRDAEIAEAFSKLLKSVSAGMLKSFRSSDNKGNQGIEFGVEWYPKIIESLQNSSDVVCILTELSVNRPWILFEAGMAKGKLNTPILGVAIGVPLSKASIGPFAQFQNSDDDLSSLTKLVRQLVKKLPNSEPDEDVIKQQVENFKQKCDAILNKRNEKNAPVIEEKISASDDSAKLFEEVKLMFKELPKRIENASQRKSDGKLKRLHPAMFEEIMHYSIRSQIDPKIFMQMLLATLKGDFPWIYEAGILLAEKLDKDKVKNVKLTKAFREFKELIVFTFETPFFREYAVDDYDYRYFGDLPLMVEYYFEKLSDKKTQKSDDNSPF